MTRRKAPAMTGSSPPQSGISPHPAVEKAIRFLKHDQSYTLDPSMSSWVLMQHTATRLVCYLRGLLFRMVYYRAITPLFLGKYVGIAHKQLIKMGRSVIIEDYVTINSLSKNGVSLGDNVKIARYAFIECTGVLRYIGVGLSMGNNSALGAYSYIGAQAGVHIGNDVIIGPRVSIFAEN
ncbi:MAG: hypothetical protein P1S60_20560, partial [Anaerolineae bacterium]|nr:hypothetical protein [Anaerolineae bacterium]